MVGAIIGDVIGSRFEWFNHLDVNFELFTEDCHFTDDTVCTIAIADALLKGIPFEKSLRFWYEKYPDCGYGPMFHGWVVSGDTQPYGSFGNGSAMRVSPCAWFSDDLLSILDAAQKSAECTHNHPEGIKGAVCVADCIYGGRNGYGKDSIRKVVTEHYSYDIDTTCDSIRRCNPFNATCQITVPQALVCFLESNDFESAIRLAVSIGSDSDTIAAITGSIAEGFYGIPDEIRQKVNEYLPNEFIKVIEEFKQKFNNKIL
jgi:ADP-ribosylglycohydrolase